MFDLDLVCFFFGTGVMLNLILTQIPYPLQEVNLRRCYNFRYVRKKPL